MEIIGISGKAGSGKDFVGKHVLEPLGYKKWALAWPMKNEAPGSNRNWTWDMVHVQKPPHVRDWLQKRGTEDGWMKYDQDYWLRIMSAWLTTMEKEWGVTRVYIPDVRFPHEVTYIQQVLGGKVARLVGRKSESLSPEQAAHLSETALDDVLDFDAFINNEASTDIGFLRYQFMQAGLIEKALAMKNPVAVAPVLGTPYWHTLYEELGKELLARDEVSGLVD